jgi:hypothetical protein
MAVYIHTDYIKEENIESTLDEIATIISRALQRRVGDVNEVISTPTTSTA